MSLRNRITSAELRQVMGVEVITGVMRSGRPKKTWLKVIRNDMKLMCLKREDALDCILWKREKTGSGQPGLSWKKAVKPEMMMMISFVLLPNIVSFNTR